MIGFSGGDRELGLNYLRECHSHKGLRSHLSGVVLTLNHLFLTAQLGGGQTPESLAVSYAF